MVEDINPPVIEVEGPAAVRGEAYGRAAETRIKRGAAYYEGLFRDRGIAIENVKRAAATLAGKLEALYPEQFQEIAAIAKGADVDIQSVLVINGRSEILNAAGQQQLAQEVEDGCTSALAMPSRTACGRLLHGQNWDWRPECERTSVILKVHRAGGPSLITYVEAGGLARAGMNSAGIAITGNNLRTDNETFTEPGIPISVIRRLVLEAPGAAEALQAVASAPRTVSNNMMISCAQDRGVAFDLETTPAEIFWLAPERGLLAHANHFVSQAARCKVRDAGLISGMDTLFRDLRVHERLDMAGNAIGFEDFVDAFFDRFGHPHGVLRSPEGGTGSDPISATVATIIMNAGEGEMHVCQSPYKNDQFVRHKL